MSGPVSYVAGWLYVSREMLELVGARTELDLEWDDDGTYRLVERNPIHGPPIPPRLAIRRALGGHAVGPYRRGSLRF